MLGVIARKIMYNLPWKGNLEKPVFVLRSDDVGVETSPTDLERIFKKAFDLGIIPSLGVIPHNIGKNTELCEWLKSKHSNNEIDIFLHGYVHYCDEFKCNILLAYRMLQEGCETINDAIGIYPPVFVAPYENISSGTLDALRIAGMSYCAFPVKVLRWGSLFYNPYNIMNYGNLKIIPRIFPVMPQNYPDMKKDIRNVFDRNGLCIVLTHHKHYVGNVENQITLDDMLEYAHGLGFEFRGISEVV